MRYDTWKREEAVYINDIHDDVAENQQWWDVGWRGKQGLM